MKLVREHIEFTRNGNVIDTLDIGKKAIIDNWFNEWAPDAEYTVDKEFNIKVKGALHLEYSQITHLLDNFTIEGSLYLYNTPITQLPENLTVGGFLDLSHTQITQITQLPDSLTVGGSIWLNNNINITHRAK